jgi:hypothetical protein
MTTLMPRRYTSLPESPEGFMRGGLRLQEAQDGEGRAQASGSASRRSPRPVRSPGPLLPETWRPCPNSRGKAMASALSV